MTRTTSQGFYVWENDEDLYDHTQLADNWDLLDSLISTGSTKVKTITSLPATSSQGDIAITSVPVSGFAANTLIRSDGTNWKAVGPIEAASAVPTSNNYIGRLIFLTAADGGFAENNLIVNTDGSTTWKLVGTSPTYTSIASATNPYDGQIIVLTAYDGSAYGGPYAKGTILVYDSATGRYVANVGVPAGSVQAYMGTTPPTGWLLCDGNPVSKTTYPYLDSIFSAASYPFGSDATTFTLPDLRGRSIIGVGTDSTINSVGKNDNISTVGLRSPYHQHSVYDPQHTHTNSVSTVDNHNHGGGTTSGGETTWSNYYNVYSQGTGSSEHIVVTTEGGGNYESSMITANNHTHGISQDGSHNHTVTINNASAGIKVNPTATSTSTAPLDATPFLALNYIIKY